MEDLTSLAYDLCRCLVLREEFQREHERDRDHRRDLLSEIAMYVGTDELEVTSVLIDVESKHLKQNSSGSGFALLDSVDDPSFVEIVDDFVLELEQISNCCSKLDVSKDDRSDLEKTSIFLNVDKHRRNAIVENVDSLIEDIENLEKQNEILHSELKRTKENAKKTADADLLKENTRLQEMLDLCYNGFVFDSKKEIESFKEFEKKHMHNRKTSKAESGRCPYVVPYVHGLGVNKVAVCQICGEKMDITDTKVW